MTNFDVSITGFVAESSGAVIGYLAEVRLDIIDDDAENTLRLDVSYGLFPCLYFFSMNPSMILIF